MCYIFPFIFPFSDKMELHLSLNGELIANKTETSHKSLNKWPSGGVFVIGQEQVSHYLRSFLKKKRRVM